MTRMGLLSRAHTALVTMLLVAMVLVPAFYFNAVTDDVFDEPREFLIVLLGAFAVVFIEARRVIEGRALFQGGSMTWPRRLVWLFLGWAALTAAFAVNSAVGWAYLVPIVAFALIGVSFLGWLGDSGGRRTAVLGAIALLTGTQLIVATAQWLKAPFLEWSTHMPALALGGRVVPGGFAPYDILVGLGVAGGEGRLMGTFGNVNYFSEFLCLALPVLVGWAATTTKRPVRWGAVLLAAAGFLAMASIGARGALIGLLLVAPLAAASVWSLRGLDPMRHWRSPRGRLVIGLGLVAGLALATFAGERVIHKLQARGQGDLAVEARLVNWRSDVGLALSRPIVGVGVGNYKVTNQDKLRADNPAGIAAVANGGRFLRAHNEPLQALIEFGLVGVLLLGVMLIAWWRSVARNDELSPALRFGIMWGVGSLVIAGCFGFPLHVPVTAIMLVLIVVLGLARQTERIEGSAIGAERRWAYAAAAIALLTGVVIHTVQKIYWPQYQAHQYLFAARALHMNDREPQALVVYGAVDRTARYRGVYRIEYVRSLVETARFAEALALLDASDREGLGFEAGYWRARALWGVGRLEEARSTYEEVKAYFSPTQGWGAKAVKDLEAIQRGEKPGASKG